jgi:hypothetical protein
MLTPARTRFIAIIASLAMAPNHRPLLPHGTFIRWRFGAGRRGGIYFLDRFAESSGLPPRSTSSIVVWNVFITLPLTFGSSMVPLT